MQQIDTRFQFSFGIIVNPTLRCNLRCWYCYEKHDHLTDMPQAVRERSPRRYQTDLPYTLLRDRRTGRYALPPRLADLGTVVLSLAPLAIFTLVFLSFLSSGVMMLILAVLPWL